MLRQHVCWRISPPGSEIVHGYETLIYDVSSAGASGGGIGADFAGATGAIAPAVKILRGRRPRGQ